jgi:hypothetical protein
MSPLLAHSDVASLADDVGSWGEADSTPISRKRRQMILLRYRHPPSARRRRALIHLNGRLTGSRNSHQRAKIMFLALYQKTSLPNPISQYGFMCHERADSFS